MKTFIELRSSAGVRRQSPHATGSWIRRVVRCVRHSTFMVVVVLLVRPAWAQERVEPPRAIEIEQAVMQPPIQTGRPIPTWWDVKILGSSLVEGRFDFVLRHDNRLLATLTTEELALTGPVQTIRVVLPPVDDAIPIDQLQVEILFHGKKIKQKLGQHILRVALSRSRTFMALVTISRLAPKRSVERDQLLRRLIFESMATPDLEDTVKTVYTPFETKDLPSEPMAYCAYELVVLLGEEFRSVKKPQLDALRSWIRAGGRLYVEPTGVLEPYHVEFLRELTSADSRGLIFQPDSAGRLVPGTILGDQRVMSVRSGLGGAVVRVEEPDAETSFDSETWRAAVAFLWRLRSEQVAVVKKQGQFDLSRLAPNVNLPMFDSNGDGIPDTVIQRGNQPQFALPIGWLSWKLPTSTGELLELLMPDGVRMVPLWLLGTILFAFVIVIGPVDYIGLGWLKARKYTWVLFPVATLAVTALTVWFSNAYMSSAEARRGLVVRDVGDDGSIVRTNRFELLFVASSRPVTTEVRKGVFSPLGTGQTMESIYQQQLMYGGGRLRYSPAQSGLESLSERSIPRIVGRVPVQFEVTQDLAKWTPQLNRMFWIPGSIEEKPVDWNSIVAGQFTTSMLASRAVGEELLKRVRSQFGNDAICAWVGPEGRWAYDRNHAWWTNMNDNPSHMSRPRFQNSYPDYTNVQLPAEIQQQGELFRWVYQHSVAMQRGLFALASQVGPKGGPELDDLPIYDPSDSERALLVVVVPRGDDFILYRKLVPIER